jgi:hypothetical protein
MNCDYYPRQISLIILVTTRKNIAEISNHFAEEAKNYSPKTFNNIIEYLQFQIERFKKGEIAFKI